MAFVLGENDFAEVVFEVFTNDKHEFAKAGVDGVVDGVVHDGFAVGAELVKLLEAAVTAAHAGSKEEKCRFHVIMNLVRLLAGWGEAARRSPCGVSAWAGWGV